MEAWLTAELLWRVSAVAVWLGACGMLIWALLAGRGRGRLRCPGGWRLWPHVRMGACLVGIPWRQGCWYDVSGAAPGSDGDVVCPECGRRQPARALGRTRMRWRWTAVACALALSGGALWVAPEIQERGWVKSTPLFVLVEIASVDAWLAHVGLTQPQAMGGPVVAELHDRLSGWDADLRSAKRWPRRVERRLERTRKLGVDAASVETLGRLQGASVTGEFAGASAMEVFAAIAAAAGVAVEVDWTGMELSPQTPVTINFDGRRCDLALRDAAVALPLEYWPVCRLVDGGAYIGGSKVTRDRFAVVEVEGLARWLQDIDAERESVGNCVEDDYCFEGDLAQTVHRPPLWDHVVEIEDILTEMVHPLMWARNGGEGAQLEAVGTTLVIAGSAEVVYETVRLIEMLDAARVSGARQVVDILPAGGLDSGRQWEPERGEPLVCLPVGGYLGLCERAEAYRAATAAVPAEQTAEWARREGDFSPAATGSALEVDVWRLAEMIAELIEPHQWQLNGGMWAILTFGDMLVIDAPAHVHERIGALLEAMRRAQATHRPVEAPDVAPGQRVRTVPLCALLLETAASARAPGNPSVLEDDLWQFMRGRLGPPGDAWSLHFCARMAVVRGNDAVQGAFDDAVEAMRGEL